MPNILITQCLQRDFVDPLGPHDPLPNSLHVGHAEARRLLGERPEEGPVAWLLSWARAQAPEDLQVLHIRDWHDPEDPQQAEHLHRFGHHCIRGTRGARLVLDLAENLAPNEHLVDALTLNDFEGTTLTQHLDRIRAQADGEPIKVGVIGVWTDAKVSFLLYDLKTRARLDDLATCSALTASSGRARHFNALDHLRQVLGVEVLDSVQSFAAWLRPGASLRPIRPRYQDLIALEGASLSKEERVVVACLFRDAARVRLDPLGGGFSGARVFRTESRTIEGHRHFPSVLKLGAPEDIGKERAAFERVEEVLGNQAPTLQGFVDIGQRAGLRFAFAGIGPGQVRPFKALYMGGAPREQVASVLRETFEEILGPFYAAARYDRMDLVEHYAFRRFAHHVRPSVESLVGAEAARAPTLTFPGGVELPNICGFYEEFLPALPPRPWESHFVSWAHGDLNGANILVDARDNVWIIDFFHTGPGQHVLKDAAKLENDLLYIMTPIADEAELAQALRLTSALREVQDLGAELPEAPPEGVSSPALLRAWETLRTLRALTGPYCREDRNPRQLDLALLRYAVHTLTFEESSPLQRRWALGAACGLAADIQAHYAATRRLRCDWVRPAPGPGRLGMTICPGRRDHDRDLAEDLGSLVEDGVQTLVCLLPDRELERAGVPDLPADAERAGLEVLRLPIPDQGVPTQEEASLLVSDILARVDAGRSVVLHCMGGLGRTGTLAACSLVARGADPTEAIATVRRCREARVVENRSQESFVEAFGAVRADPGAET